MQKQWRMQQTTLHLASWHRPRPFWHLRRMRLQQALQWRHLQPQQHTRAATASQSSNQRARCPHLHGLRCVAHTQTAGEVHHTVRLPAGLVTLNLLLLVGDSGAEGGWLSALLEGASVCTELCTLTLNVHRPQCTMAQACAAVEAAAPKLGLAQLTELQMPDAYMQPQQIARGCTSH